MKYAAFSCVPSDWTWFYSGLSLLSGWMLKHLHSNWKVSKQMSDPQKPEVEADVEVAFDDAGRVTDAAEKTLSESEQFVADLQNLHAALKAKGIGNGIFEIITGLVKQHLGISL